MLNGRARGAVAQSFVDVVVEVFAIDERIDQPRELFVPAAGQRARLEPRVAFPGATLRDQILLERGERYGQRSARAVGSKAYVDAKHVAIGRDLG